jgi:hypothetical protein
MICIQLNGGLGNQMFQYALGRTLSLKNNCELILDTSILAQKTNSKVEIVRDFELEIFNIVAKVASKSELKEYKPILLKIINSLVYRLGFPGITLSNYYIEQQFSFNKKVLKAAKNCFLSGYWQSQLYFESIASVIIEDFQFPIIDDSINLYFLSEIKKSNSVSIHLRRGDFLNVNTHNIHGTCSLEYYQGAISYIKSKIINPVFFIFSDDIPWVKSNVNFEAQTHFVSGNVLKKSYIDMQLMSYCKHNIIANSSFSWWGAWLNTNIEKIVIAPQVWFSDKKMESQTKDLIPNTWIRL